MSLSHLKRTRSPSPAPADAKRCKTEKRKEIRFLILSDTHGADLPSTLPKCDVLLHCGDFTEDGSAESISRALKDMGKIEAELKLIIAGNHEISLDHEYYVSEGGSITECERAQDLLATRASSEASQSGLIFLKEGTHTFTLSSGATFKIYASPYTPKYGASGFQYATNEDRFNPAATSPSWAQNTSTAESLIPQDVDIIMTHGPPQYVLDGTSDGRSAGCEQLRRAIARVKPKLHCFGHIHGGYGAQRLAYKEEPSKAQDDDTIVAFPKEWVGKNQAKRKGFAGLPPGSQEDFRQGKQTLCVNAAMEGEKGVLENAPWLVDLELSVE